MLHSSGNSIYFLPKSNLAPASLLQSGHKFLGLSLSTKHLEGCLACRQGSGTAKACAGEREGASAGGGWKEGRGRGNLLGARHGPEQHLPAGHALCNVVFGMSFRVTSTPRASSLCVPQAVASRKCPSLTQEHPNEVK